MNNKLLTRDQFRDLVFERDGNRCVVCHGAGDAAHHIMERRLFDDGGYYLDNGATLCADCHYLAETTQFHTDYIRHCAGIEKVVLPPYLYDDCIYDKWGNIILGNRRIKGPLFHEESVQKVLEHVLHLFSNYVKYPRTYHLPWSPGFTKDDRILNNVDHFLNRPIVITEKMDGENTTMYRDYMHARSIDSEHHASQSWARNLHSRISSSIPFGWRICGENLYAKHSIQYNNLESYFLVFSIWDDKNNCLSWNDTLDWCSLLDLAHVPVRYTSSFLNSSTMQSICKQLQNDSLSEGYVIRVVDEFHYSAFRHNIAKYVRDGHVSTTHHWKRSNIIKNSLGENR